VLAANCVGVSQKSRKEKGSGGREVCWQRLNAPPPSALASTPSHQYPSSPKINKHHSVPQNRIIHRAEKNADGRTTPILRQPRLQLLLRPVRDAPPKNALERLAERVREPAGELPFDEVLRSQFSLSVFPFILSRMV
jgi:hypothetical protein